MGGRGSGGARVGAGRKRKDNLVAFLSGGRVRAGRPPGAPGVTPAPVECPADTPEAERLIWALHAPDALRAGTLTPQTALAFVSEVCRPHVFFNKAHATLESEGWTYWKQTEFGKEPRKHPLLTELLNWHKRIEAGHAKFCLAPFGKPLAVTEKVENRFAKFEAQA